LGETGISLSLSGIPFHLLFFLGWSSYYCGVGGRLKKGPLLIFHYSVHFVYWSLSLLGCWLYLQSGEFWLMVHVSISKWMWVSFVAVW
jgi:hypothetical protein